MYCFSSVGNIIFKYMVISIRRVIDIFEYLFEILVLLLLCVNRFSLHVNVLLIYVIP